MATGEEIGKDYPTLMPALTDDANIQEAFTMYHYGLTSYTGIEVIPEDSIEGHFEAVNERVTLLEGRPIAGGVVSPTEPTETGTPPQPIPEGYIWVDSDSISDFSTAWPTVIYSPTDPSASLTMADVGTLWIDENDTAAVLNVNNYLTTASANANLATITNVSNQIEDLQDSLASHSFLLMGA